MSNTIITPTIIAKEAALQVVNNMVMGNLVHRDFKNEFVKIGDTVSYRRPVKFVVNDGADITSQVQDVVEYKDTLQINKRKNVAFSIPSADLTLSIEKISERYITPAAIRLANQIDSDGLAEYIHVYNAEGTAGTTPNSFALLGAPSKKLNQYAVPLDNRNLVLNPAAQFQAADVMKGLYHPKMIEDAFRSVSIGPIAGMDTYMAQNVKSHTAGVGTGTPTVTGTITASTGNPDTAFAVTTTAWTVSTTGIVKAGDIITFGVAGGVGVYGVNPVSGESTGELQQFVVTADANSAASTGASTISVLPAMIVTGPYKTVTRVPVASEVINFTASHAANLAFHKNAFALVTCPIEVPEDATGAMMTYKDVSIRYVKWYNGVTDQQIYRLDILYGWKTVYPEFAVRLKG